jgi:hypothetical protein
MRCTTACRWPGAAWAYRSVILGHLVGLKDQLLAEAGRSDRHRRERRGRFRTPLDDAS